MAITTVNLDDRENLLLAARMTHDNQTLRVAEVLNEDKILQIRNNFRGNDTVYMYCNETVFTQLQILAKDKNNVHWPPDSPFGKPQMFFLDMPVRRSDAITDVEGIIS